MPVTGVPEKIQVNINHLQVGQSITVAELVLPKDATSLGNPKDVVVQCTVPAEMPEEEEAEAGEAEPEVIGGRKEDEEGESD